MIDILKQKQFFPLKNFEDVQRLFEYNIDESNGEPNLALLSIVAGLIEHSLVTVIDKDDLNLNSRSVDHRKDSFQRRFASDRWMNLAHNQQPHHHQDSNQQQSHHLSSTSSENHSNHQQQQQPQQHQHNNKSGGGGNNNNNTSSNNNNNNNNNSNNNSNNSTNNGNNGNKPPHQNKRKLGDTDSNEAGYVSSASESSDDESTGDSSRHISPTDNLAIPEIEFEVVETLYKRFVDQFRGSIDFKEAELHRTNLKIKRISDSVWEHLSNSYYKDKTHLQSIFSYLTTSKLDCFGLAFAVIAGCQILNLKNIYLALSEDHAWVMFDLRDEEMKSHAKQREMAEFKDNDAPVPACALHGTCEVTWHGKANSDKRGQPVTYKNCWLYTNGYAVKCDIRQCVVALVNSISPSINSNTDSEVLAFLQQRLLWLLYKRKMYFPMSLGNLGELEDLYPTPNAPMTPHELYNLGIEISRTQYNDSHVYPYTYLASYFYKYGRFKEALETWADESAVMINYNYSRDDEEVYKEFFEIANELIPSMLKVLTAGGLEPGRVSLKPFLQDPECLALILKFYDNICCWEEGSSTPVLHIGWAKNFVTTVLKFNPIIRSKIKLFTQEEWTHNKACASECEVSSRADQCSSTASDQLDLKREDDETSANGVGLPIKQEVNYSDEDEEEDEDEIDRDLLSGTVSKLSPKLTTATSGKSSSSSSSIAPRKIAQSTEDKVDTSESTGVPNKSIKLMAGEERTADSASNSTSLAGSSVAGEENRLKCIGRRQRERRLEFDNENNVAVILKSRKIAGVRDLLQAERLNKTAIELQLTAQSQCAVRGRSNSSSYSNDFISSAFAIGGSSTRSKRSQR